MLIRFVQLRKNLQVITKKMGTAANEKVIKPRGGVLLAGESMSMIAYVLFKVNSGTEREVCQKIVTFSEVIEADVIFGEYDVIAKISAPDLAALEDFLSQKLRNVPSIVLTSTMVVGREYKGISQRPKSK